MNAIISLCHFCEVHGPSVMFCTQAFHSDEPQHLLEDNNGRPNGQSEVKEEKKFYGNLDLWLRTPSPLTMSRQPKISDTCVACRSMDKSVPGFVSNDHEACVSYVSSQYPQHPEVFSLVRQACVRSLSCEVCPGREGPIFFGDEHRGHVFSYTFFLKDSQSRGFQRWYSIVVVMMDKIFLLNSWPFLCKQIRNVIDSLQEKANRVYDQEQSECPQRAMRLNMATFEPRDFRRQRSGNKTARSLFELTNDRDTFRNLHKWFAWILRAGGNRMTEKILEGAPTEDTIIDMEQQEETEEGFIKVITKTMEVSECLNMGGTTQDRTQTVTRIGLEENSDDEEDDNNDVDCPTFRNLRHLLRVLDYERFHALAYHTVIGNQVIVRCERKNLVKSVFDVLKSLLPKGCCREVLYSKSYEDSWKCNFLGLHPSASLPDHVKISTLHIILDIGEKLCTPGEHTPPADNSSMDRFTFIIRTAEPPPALTPTYLAHVEKKIVEPKISNDVLQHVLVALREKWMNKVKLLFKYCKSGTHSEEDVNKLLALLGENANEEDNKVLKFWKTGLSVHYKKHVLARTNSQTITDV